ncbi:MAG: hypothetical protein ACQEV7_23055, partial [Bacillota bacterium]
SADEALVFFCFFLWMSVVRGWYLLVPGPSFFVWGRKRLGGGRRGQALVWVEGVFCFFVL